MNQFLKAYRHAVILFLMAAVAFPFLWILKPFWITIVLGLVFAVAISPSLDFVENKLKGRTRLSLFVLFSSMTLLFVIPFGLTLIKGVQTLRSQIDKYSNEQSIQQFKRYQEELISRFEVFNEYGIDTQVINEQLWGLVEKTGTLITGVLSDTVTKIPELLLLFFVLVLSMISFLLMKNNFNSTIEKIDWLSQEGLRRLTSTFINCCRSVVLSSFVTGFAQALLTAVGAVIFTDYQFLLVFFITFLLSFIPVIGAGPVSLIMALIAFSDSHWASGIGLLIFAGLASILDNILRPLLLAGKTQIPSIWALFCTIGAIIVFGLPGLFVGPLIGALAFELLPILADEY
jgi:predicted PurR-regulated permease PerM